LTTSFSLNLATKQVLKPVVDIPAICHDSPFLRAFSQVLLAGLRAVQDLYGLLRSLVSLLNSYFCRKILFCLTILRNHYPIHLRMEGIDMLETDTFYIEQCLDGHPDDFRFLVKRYQGALMGHLTGKLGNRDHAEEAAQESFVRAYFNVGKLKKPESFFAWLLGISNRVAQEFQRKEQVRQQRDVIRSTLEQSQTPQLSQDYGLENAIAGLPETYREVILLRYYSQMSCKQIAEQLQQPLGTVTKTLSRAYALLRQQLQNHSQPESEVAL
jgi:RNA polymerase sigma-70 factor, ECF subfamily